MINNKLLICKNNYSNRIVYIDEIKGFGIILVMLNHFNIYYHPISDIISAGYMTWFFIASGVTYKSKDLSILSNIGKKAQRLLIPYFFYSFIFSIPINEKKFIGILYSRYMLFDSNIQENIYLLHYYITPLWFLTAMFITYILFFLYELCKKPIYKFLYILLSFIVTIFLNKIQILLPWSIDTAFIASIFIIIGFELKNIFNSEYKNNILNVILLLFIIPLIYYNGETNMSIRIYGNHNELSVVYFIIIGFTSFYILRSIFILIGSKFLISQILSTVGKQSLRLMCIHIFFISNINKILILIFHISNIITILLSIIITIIISIYIDSITKKQNNIALSFLFRNI